MSRKRDIAYDILSLVEAKMEEIIKEFGTETKERARLAYEWDVLQKTGNTKRMESAINEMQAARKKGYLTLSGEQGGQYIVATDNFFVGGAANCSYLLFCAGITKVDPIQYRLPFERFVNPLLCGQVEIPLAAKHPARAAGERDLVAALTERGSFGKEIITPRKRNGIAKEILQETNGHLLFQEQAMELLHEMGGYSYAEADVVRRQLAKRHFQYVGRSFEDQFIDRARKRGCETDAREFLRELVQCSGKLAPKCAILGELLNEK